MNASNYSGEIGKLKRPARQGSIDILRTMNTVDHVEEESHESPSIEQSAVPSLTKQHVVISTPRVSNLSPSLAAAMLSLPWPPPLESDIKEKKNDPKKIESKFASGLKTTPIPSIKKMISTKSSLSRKAIQKKMSKSRSRYLNDPEANSEDIEKEYSPFRIPTFDEVHTNWPGFDHEPIPNWQEKYMIAKPYPRELMIGNDLNKPSTINNNFELSDDQEDSDEEKVNIKSRQRPSKSTVKSTGAGDDKPRRRLQVERVGSCIR